ncbi:hypothetical protein CYMTET_36173, partial [Cymbomonas tetramitiformis]
IVFHGMALHSAGGNPSVKPRRVLSTRWVGDDARCAARPWETSPPVHTDGTRLLPRYGLLSAVQLNVSAESVYKSSAYNVF